MVLKQVISIAFVSIVLVLMYMVYLNEKSKVQFSKEPYELDDDELVTLNNFMIKQLKET